MKSLLSTVRQQRGYTVLNNCAPQRPTERKWNKETKMFPRTNLIKVFLKGWSDFCFLVGGCRGAWGGGQQHEEKETGVFIKSEICFFFQSFTWGFKKKSCFIIYPLQSLFLAGIVLIKSTPPPKKALPLTDGFCLMLNLVFLVIEWQCVQYTLRCCNESPFPASP